MTPNSYLRFVYARGLSRPDEQDIAQALSWTVAGNGANRYSLSLGNANLKAETGDDLDLLFDHYLNPFGEVSVGYFYKFLQNSIISHTFDLDNFQPPGGPLSNYLATQPVNGGSAWISGVEAAYLQHFTFLPGLWGGLGLSANYGFTASRIPGIPGRSDHPRLLWTSPIAFNISPTYDRGRFSVRVGMSYNQANIYSYQYTDGTPGGVNGRVCAGRYRKRAENWHGLTSKRWLGRTEAYRQVTGEAWWSSERAQQRPIQTAPLE